jgi:septum formation inhibitor MinC
MKKGKLTKEEIFYIEQNPENLSIKELSQSMDRKIDMVARHYKEQEPVLSSEPPSHTQPINIDSSILQLMGRHKRKDQYVATVMTQAASELADNTRPDRIKSPKLMSAIHKPKG